MKLILFIFTLFLLSACSSNKGGVYWCGDHPCINKKEKEAYFQKNMIVEKRNFKKEKSKNKNDLEQNIEQAKIKEKKRVLSEKDLLKEAKLNEKQRLKNEKRMLKEAKIREKELLKEEKKLEKKVKNDEKVYSKVSKEKKNIEKDKVINVDLGVVSAKASVSKFTKMKQKIYSKNSSRSYPDINNIPN